MQLPYGTVGGPRIGSRVIAPLGNPEAGQAIFDAQVAEAVKTGSGIIGPRVSGPLQGTQNAPRLADEIGHRVDDSKAPPVEGIDLPIHLVNVQVAIAQIQRPGAILDRLWDEEHLRTNGPRKSVIAAIREAGFMG